MTEIDKDGFASVIVHDMRTPLNACVMSLSLLELKASQPAEVLKSVEVIRRNLDRQALLVADLADALQMVRDGLTVQLEDADLVDLVDDATEKLAPIAGVDIRWAGPRPHGLEVAADPERLGRAIGALLDIVATGRQSGERIELAGSRTDGAVRLEIRRVGAGSLERTGQDAAASTAQKRPLMRLTVAAEIIAKHGGSLEVEERHATVELPAR